VAANDAFKQSSGAWPSTERTHDVPIGPREAPLTLKQVFDEHAPYVWRTLRYCGVATSDLQDVCQEVFLVVHRRLSEFEGRSSMRTWLYQVCLRVAAGYRRRAHLRREQIMAEPPEPIASGATPEVLERHAAREILGQILDGLDPLKREVFVLYEIEERPMSEIAEVVGCPLRTAYSRLEAARKEVLKAWERAQARSKRV